MRYIEIIVLINLVIHLSFVSISNYILGQKRNVLLIFVSSIIDIIYIIFYLLYPYKIDNIKYLIVYLISILPFLSKGIIKALISSLVYLMLNFSLGGTSEVIFNIINNFYAVLISLFTINLVFIIYYLFKKVNVDIKNLNYQICIIDNNKKYLFEGYCDTGNFLSSDENIPIIFINNKYKLGNYRKDMIVNTVSVAKVIKLYEVDKFLIKINNKFVKKEVYLAYTNIGCQVMFGLNLLGG